MWGRDAAPEENCGTGLRPHLRKSGLAFRGRCNGPPQGLVCPPAWVGKPRSISAGRYRRPAEEAVGEGKRLNISPRFPRLRISRTHLRRGDADVCPSACVTPAKAGIQSFLSRVPRELDSGFCRNDEAEGEGGR